MTQLCVDYFNWALKIQFSLLYPYNVDNILGNLKLTTSLSLEQFKFLMITICLQLYLVNSTEFLQWTL